MFEKLHPTCDPVHGLFYLQNDKPEITSRIQRGEEVVATGVAFLITTDGLAVTCAHVVERVGGRPGSIVWLHSAVAPVSVAARVVPEMWVGPMWRDGGFPESPSYPGFADKRAETYKQDVAVLRIDPTSARWSVVPGANRRGVPVFERPKRSSPLPTLVKSCRVLPMGVPGYGRRTPVFDAWLFGWHHAQPTPIPGRGTFAGCHRGPYQYDAIVLRSDTITHGFSGSPLWDDERRLVVGMVTQTLSDTVKDTASGTDARFILKHSKAPREIDARLAEAYQTLAALPMMGPTDLDMGSWNWGNGRDFVEPRIRPVVTFDPLLQSQKPPGSLAIERLRALLEYTPLVYLQGVAGCGKTTLARQLARRCVVDRWEIDARPVIPLLTTAADLLRSGKDLAAVLDSPSFTFSSTLVAGDFRRCLEDNDATVVLIVDALDEVAAADQMQVLLRLTSIVRSSGSLGHKWPDFNALVDVAGRHIIRHAMVASRPLVTCAGIERMGFQAFELAALDPNGVREIAKARFPQDDQRTQFLAALADVGWDRDEPTPLQVRIAADVFHEYRELPTLAKDLVYRFIDLRINYGSDEKRSFRSVPVPSNYRGVYQKHLAWMLEFLATATSDKKRKLIDFECEIVALQDPVARPPWLDDAGGFSRFMLDELPALTQQLVRFDSDRLPTGVVWLHKTFADALNARWLLRSAEADPRGVRRLFSSDLDAAVEMNALGLLEVRGQYESVEQVLSTWLQDGPLTAGETSRKAIRALAAGIDAGGRLRPLLAQELLRIVLAEFDSAALCRAFFSSDELPAPITLIKRTNLEKDVVNAMHVRLQRRTHSAHLSSSFGMQRVKLSEREARLFDELKLWNRMGEGYQFVDPRADAAGSASLSSPTVRKLSSDESASQPLASHMAGYDISGGYTSLLVRRPNGDLMPLNVDTDSFLAGIVTLAREHPRQPVGDLVNLVIRFLVQLPGGI